jgi:hypothetical protein
MAARTRRMRNGWLVGLGWVELGRSKVTHRHLEHILLAHPGNTTTTTLPLVPNSMGERRLSQRFSDLAVPGSAHSSQGQETRSGEEGAATVEHFRSPSLLSPAQRKEEAEQSRGGEARE